MTEDHEPTAKLDVPVPVVSEEELPPRVAELRDRLASGGWLDVIAAAGLGFLVLLAVGGVLVLAAKLNYPQLGGGADILSAFNAIVMAGLGTLGIPIVIDGLAASALPLGALVVVGAGIAWAIRTSLGEPYRFPSVRSAVIHGLRVGLPFGVLCWFFALVFRSRGTTPVASDAGVALLAGAFWGALFGALGAVRTMEPLHDAVARVWSGLRARDEKYFTGISAAGVMFGVVAMLAAVATLVWVIITLAQGPPGRHFGAGDAIAYVVYLAAFLPNILLGVTALSFGAGIDVGAKIDVGGRLLGPLHEYSLFAWGRGEPPIYLWALVVIPAVACGLGGLYARRRSEGSAAMVPVLLTASGTFAVTITLLAALGPLRMAGVLKGSGFALIAPDVIVVFVSTFLVSGLLGFVGWKIAEMSNVFGNRFPRSD